MVDINRRDSIAHTDAHEVALDSLLAGIEAAHPHRLVEERMSVEDGSLSIESERGGGTYDLDGFDNVFVVGGGNAAGHLTRAIEAKLGERLTDGVIVTDDPADTEQVNVVPGDHPVPSERGVRGARRVVELAQRAGEDDLVLACVTGGGSALLPVPAGELSLSDLQSVTEALLACGATIDEINAVRKHCSAIKGGQIARAVAPATLASLVVSDVIGNDLGVIASGPTVPDPTTYADALEVIERYDVDAPDAVREHLRRGVNSERPETPEPDDPAFDRTKTYILGSGRTALNAACNRVDERGYEPLLLSSRVRGEAREAAVTHVAIAEEVRDTHTPVVPPAVLVSGGETTVTLAQDHGEGGPNQEFTLSGGTELEMDGIVVASVDTDGIDGATDAAGAVVDADTVDDDVARAALDRNDALPVLERADALIRTGPTGTNVNDLRVIVIEPVD